ncbi:hypothetical protein B0H13DRAFT_2469122 [Mycena leptocephala]|nr:hypothetical protein B0H13DRAFT_2469122 [Mycena leptocephala]
MPVAAMHCCYYWPQGQGSPIMHSGIGPRPVTLHYTYSLYIILSHSGLHLDFIRHAAEMGVSCSKWESDGNFDSNAQIIWATVEHIEVQRFHAFASQLAAEDRLDRFFWDEIHRLFTDSHYRAVFLSAASLA